MNTTELALLGFLIWFLILHISIAILRSELTLSGKMRANRFKVDGSDVSPFSGRLCRAHANCYESFPFIGGLMLFSIATGHTEVTNSLALVMLGARICQSSIHLYSTSIRAVTIRFAFLLIQLSIACYWVIGFFLR